MIKKKMETKTIYLNGVIVHNSIRYIAIPILEVIAIVQRTISKSVTNDRILLISDM